MKLINLNDTQKPHKFKAYVFLNIFLSSFFVTYLTPMIMVIMAVFFERQNIQEILLALPTALITGLFLGIFTIPFFAMYFPCIVIATLIGKIIIKRANKLLVWLIFSILTVVTYTTIMALFIDFFQNFIFISGIVGLFTGAVCWYRLRKY